MPKVYYLGGLAKKEKETFTLRAGDKVITMQNKIGAWIELPHQSQADDLIETHRLLTKFGEFPAFTTDARQVSMAIAAANNKNAPKPAPAMSREEMIKSLSKKELLELMRDMSDDDEEESVEETDELEEVI